MSKQSSEQTLDTGASPKFIIYKSALYTNVPLYNLCDIISSE